MYLANLNTILNKINTAYYEITYFYLKYSRLFAGLMLLIVRYRAIYYLQERPIMNRKEFFHILILATSIYFTLGCSQSSPVSRDPYLQMGTSNSVIIVWRTSKAIVPRVLFSEELGSSGREVFKEEISLCLSSDSHNDNEGQTYLFSAPNNTHQYQAQVRNLKADTIYYYSIYDGNEVVAGGDSEHFFRTYPNDKDNENTRPLRFWVLGDSGTGGNDQEKVFQGLQKYLDKNNFSLDGYLHVGDMAYDHGQDCEFQNNFFSVYKSLLRQVVCWPTIGNHESSTGEIENRPYNDAYILPTKAEAGGFPSGTESYYSFEIGPIHFISLDSQNLNRRPIGEMALWLKKDLEKNKKAWIIAYWHHPPYTKGTHDSDTEIQHIEMREHIMPILESGGVDLILGGHSHIYERSMLIDGAYATPTTSAKVILDDGDGDKKGDGAYIKSAGIHPHQGSVAIVTGNGGARLGQDGISPVMKKTLLVHGSVVIEIHQDTLEVVMIDQRGQVQDRFHLVKKGKVHLSHLSNVWETNGPEQIFSSRYFTDQTQVTLVARPQAPDAKIYYTLDGSEPSFKALRYQKPILVRKTCVLKAFSAWRNNTRVSPISSLSYQKSEPVFELSLQDINSENIQQGISRQKKNLASGKVEEQDIVDQVAYFPDSETESRHSIHWSGYWKVEKKGLYTLFGELDQEVDLTLNQKIVLNSKNKTRAQMVSLFPGFYQLDLRFSPKNSSPWMGIGYELARKKTPIAFPASSLFIPSGKNKHKFFLSRISSSPNDAEENANGKINLDSSDLDLGENSQTIGLYYPNLDIPAKAKIHRAYLQFSVDEKESVKAKLNIQIERKKQARAFYKKDYNISQRNRSLHQVTWFPDPWKKEKAQGEKQRSPNLNFLIKELVHLPGWKKSNPVAFILTGKGRRTATSYDKSSSEAPFLYVEYTP